MKIYNCFRNFLASIRHLSIVWGEVRIHPSARVRYSMLRGDINIGARASVYRSDLYGCVEVLEGASVTGPGVYFHSLHERIVIGEYSSIAPSVVMITSGHCLSAPTTSFKAGGVMVERPISVGCHCWLAAGVKVIGGAQVEDYSIVASGAVLTGKRYTGRAVWGGVPARKLKPYLADG